MGYKMKVKYSVFSWCGRELMGVGLCVQEDGVECLDG